MSMNDRAESTTFSIASPGSHIGGGANHGFPSSPTTRVGVDFSIAEAFPNDEGQSQRTNIEPTIGLLSPLSFTKRYTKLEVINARQVTRILNWQYAIIIVGLVYTLGITILVNTAFMRIFFTPKDQGWEYDFRVYNLPNGVIWFNVIGKILVFLAAALLSLIFSIRVLAQRKNCLTHEQVWVICLLISVSIYLLPVIEIVDIHDLLLPDWITQGFKWKGTRFWNQLEPVVQVMFTTGFTCSTLFYVWASMHSYRFLESNIGIRFYVPKIFPLAMYVAGKLAILYREGHFIYSAELPLANFTGMVSLYFTADYWDKVGMCSAIAITLADIFFIVCILYERRRTKMVLKAADYHKYRSKQIGFRFFMYHNITFYSIYIATYIALQLSIPNGAAVFEYYAMKPRVSNFRTHKLNLGLNIMLLAYCWTEAYANLPADALGFRGWFSAQSPRGFGANVSELEPITYRKREPPSMHGVVSDVNINCFIMQTHVTMFNFAWLVYYWDTRKVENFKITQDVFKFNIADYIKDKLTDTHALVVDGVDRIVVAFKGTTSLKNLKTDLKMFHSPLRSLLPTPLPDMEDEIPPAAEEVVGSRLWRRAQIHQGFATAYRAVAPQLLNTVSRLQEKKRRPVFITGHSLGGALATVCSLDLLVTLGLTRREIFVSTFGAPRVGNSAFRELYDTGVPIHWRMVVGPDVVAKLPKLGYTHCGKKVLITVDGDLFMDPNSLELNLWSGDTASILYHRKASYLLAMRAWCTKHHGDEYVPEFWPFPVSNDESKLFEHVQNKHETIKHEDEKRAKLIEFDALIEKMDSGAPESLNDNVMKWKRLAVLLLNKAAEK